MTRSLVALTDARRWFGALSLTAELEPGLVSSVASLASGLPALGMQAAATSFANASEYGYDFVQVSIWNTGETFYIDDAELWNWIRGYFDWDGTYRVYDYVECAYATDEWYSEQDELANFDADSVDYDAAIESVNNFTCQSQGNAKKICMDLFIAAKRAGPLNGDNRDSDPSAQYAASRAQIYFDFDGMSATMHLSNSSTWIPFIGYAPPDTAESGAWM